MSLMSDVVRLVGELGEATGDDLVPYLPYATRRQILVALQNSANRGRVRCIRRQPRTDKFAGPGVYVVCEARRAKPVRSAPLQPPPNSVFQMADRMAA